MANKKIQDRIASLLRRAEHPNTTPEEAQACQEKAEALIQKYRLEEAELHLTEEQKRVFEKKAYNRTTFDGWSYEFGGMVISIGEHANCYATYSFEDRGYVILGYPHDVFYADVLIGRAIEAYNELIYPRWDDTYSFERNVHRLKTAGSTWEGVLYDLPSTLREEVWEKYKWPLDYLERSFRKYEKKMGMEPVTFTRRQKAYQDTLRRSFRNRLDDRLHDLKKKATQDLVEERDRLAVAIVQDEDALKQEFYRLFPNHSPEAQKKRREEMEREKAARESEFNALSEEEQKKAREKQAKADARARKEWEEFQERNRPDPGAWAVGVQAADRVRLSLNDEVQDTRVFIEA